MRKFEFKRAEKNGVYKTILWMKIWVLLLF